MRYGHLNMYEREVIEVVRRTGGSLREAAERIGRAPSTVSREVRRNQKGGRYEARRAHGVSSNRLRAWRRPRRFDDGRLRRKLWKGLCKDYSPEQIAGTWPDYLSPVSIQTIYTCVHEERPAWRKHLRQAQSRACASYRKPGTYQRIRNQKTIAERPAIVGRRIHVGDWERDTIRGADRQAGIATHVDRRTGYVILALLKDRSATRDR